MKRDSHQYLIELTPVEGDAQIREGAAWQTVLRAGKSPGQKPVETSWLAPLGFVVPAPAELSGPNGEAEACYRARTSAVRSHTDKTAGGHPRDSRVRAGAEPSGSRAEGRGKAERGRPGDRRGLAGTELPGGAEQGGILLLASVPFYPSEPRHCVRTSRNSR